MEKRTPGATAVSKYRGSVNIIGRADMRATFQPTLQDYEAAFRDEADHLYPVVDRFEASLGYALDRAKLETAARILACPVKANPPCWQHGRVLYAVARRAIEGRDGPVTLLDIGSAKGFSALVARWALDDAKVPGEVVTVDVISPGARVRRNSVFELDGEKTLTEFLAPWPESKGITAYQSTGIHWLVNHPGRLPFVFVDGKHSGDVVAQEGRLIADRQRPGDAVVFDDVHLPDVKAAVMGLAKLYQIEQVNVLPNRAYSVAIRR